MQSFREFYVEYLRAHSNVLNRVFHTVGVIQLLGCAIIAIVFNAWIVLLPGIFLAYLFPHIGHRYFEKNKSMRASHPVYCVLGAGKMFFGIFKRVNGRRSTVDSALER